PPAAKAIFPAGNSQGTAPLTSPSASHSSEIPLWNRVVLMALIVLLSLGPVRVGYGAVGEKKILYCGTKSPAESLSWLKPWAASAGSGLGCKAKSSAAPFTAFLVNEV